MASVLGAIRRNWQAQRPINIDKTENPLRFGILGAATIAPMALITPSRSHPDITIHAVAARDRSKAEVFAKKHGIPVVFDSYEDLISSPSIDCIYIPLPNGLHARYAHLALSAGKHVYLEKPACSNAAETRDLFSHPALLDQGSSPLVLLEAAHSWFHPAFALFLSHLGSAEEIEVATATMNVVGGGLIFGDDDIRFDLGLSGGSMMDLGPYTIGILRLIFGYGGECVLPDECVKAETKIMKEGVDSGFEARFRFPGGGVGVARGDLKVGLVEGFTGEVGFQPVVEVRHRGVKVSGEGAKGKMHIEDGQELVKTRTVRFRVFPLPTIWHGVEIEDEFEVKVKGDSEGQVVRKWVESRTEKAYSFKDVPGMEGQAGDDSWMTYRYCLEQFINRVRGRETTQWFTKEDSIGAATMIDMAYEKAGLPVRGKRE